MGRGNDEPLFPASLFEYQNRPRRDGFFAVAYIVSLVATCIGGIIAFSQRNPHYTKLTRSDHLNDPNSCPVGPGRRLLQDIPDSDEFRLSQFLVMAGVWVVVSFVGSTILGVLFVNTFKNRAHFMLKLTIAIQIAIPLVSGIALCFVALPAGLILLGLAALTAICFYVWRDRFPLVARLISVAARGLSDNPAVMWIVLLLQLGLTLLSIPILFSMIVAYMNGSLAPNPDSADASGGQCRSASGDQVACCVWQTDAWVPVYISFAGIMMSWSTFLSFEIKVFTISGTIAQWYFAPATATSFRGNATRSLRHAFGPSFGSLCLGSGILTLCDMLKRSVENARRENGNNILVCLLACIATCIASFIEFITKFATVRAAISGEGFLGASRSAFDLLKRNFLNTIGVWWLPPLVLQTCCFCISLVWALAIGVLSYSSWLALGRPQAGLSAFLLGLIAFFFSLVILSFFASVLLNVVDAVYVCYAMDRDHQQCTKPAVHEVYSQLPTVGPIVENPDGGVSYAAPSSQYNPPGPSAPYAPPPMQQAAPYPAPQYQAPQYSPQHTPGSSHGGANKV